MLIVSFLLMALYVFYTYSGATAMTQFCVASPCYEAIAIRAVRPQFLVFRRGRPTGVVIEVIEATYIADVEESAQARTAGNRFHLVAPRRLIGLAEERYLVAIVGLPRRIPLEAARAARSESRPGPDGGESLPPGSASPSDRVGRRTLPGSYSRSPASDSA